MSVPGQLNPSPRLLLGPGPSDAHPRVLAAMTTPLLGHLDPQFLQIMDEIQDMLRQVFQTRNPLTLTVSGTGMAGMEACLVNLIEPGDSMLGLWALGSMHMALSLHVALRSPLADVLGACAALRTAGVTPLSFFGEETDEPSGIGWMPAAAVYFRAPDRHPVIVEPAATMGLRALLVRPDRSRVRGAARAMRAIDDLARSADPWRRRRTGRS